VVGVVWRAELRSGSTLRSKELSDGQRQDLALAIFLAQARTLQGTFFLDEPLLHLDDVNTVGVIDVFRVLAMEDRDLRLVVTTANERLVRLFEEKFRPVDVPGRVALRVIELEGNPRVGVTARVRDVGGG
jgi:ABC-type lipoprotein export system ATPase subunit